MSEFFARPYQERDFPNLLYMARRAGTGVTTLSRDEARLRAYTERALETFQNPPEKPGGIHLIVLVHAPTEEVVGTASIKADSLGPDIGYHYEVRGNMLHPKKRRKRVTEVCALYLRPSYRKSGIGRLLSLSRLLLIAHYPEYFHQRIMAVLRGKISHQKSPFWTAVGERLTKLSFEEALKASDKDASLFAKMISSTPLDSTLLSQAAQKCIGKPHKNTKPAYKLLTTQGLTYKNQISITEGGPHLTGSREDVFAIRESKIVSVPKLVDKPKNARPCLLFHPAWDWRCCIGNLAAVPDDWGVISKSSGRLLNLEEGTTIRYAPLYPLQRASRTASS